MADLRMPSVNQVILAGHIVREAELKYTTGGMAVASTTLAVDRAWKDKSTGEVKKKTAWLKIQAWDRTAQNIAGLAKGAPIMVFGRLETEEWEDRQSGKKQSKTFINVDRFDRLSWDAGASDDGATPRPATQKAPEPPQEDDLPF